MNMEPLIFLGAGASKPFGIPTMKEMVTTFEKELDKNASGPEKTLYRYVRRILEKRYPGGVDLEMTFSLIDAIANEIKFKKLGDVAYFYQNKYLKGFQELNKYKDKRTKDIENAIKLRMKFEVFIKEKCHIKQRNINKIEKVYSEFFNEVSKTGGQIGTTSGQNYSNWSIFTTNYDQAVEIFCNRSNINLNTGFVPKLNKFVLNHNAFNETGRIGLIKLHGSINWLREDSGDVVSYPAPVGSQTTYDGRRILEELMVYPISEKYIYSNPFLHMFHLFNERLRDTKKWLIIGYSLRDPAIKNLIIENATKEKRIVFVHPRADEIVKKELPSIPDGVLYPINSKFGKERLPEIIDDHLRHNIPRVREL